MSFFYRLAYRLGIAPWERAATHPPAVRQIAMLFAREEAGRAPPFGRALDLGCGRGHWSIVLAQRGWQVTGVELVASAAREARRRARAAGVEVQILQGDIAALRQAGVGAGYRLIWDFGTLHGLNPQQLRAVGREVDAIGTDDATVLILAWAPGRRGPLPRGASREELEAAFVGWTVTDDEPFDATGLPAPLRRVRPRVYRLRRAPGPTGASPTGRPT
jgi:SAM-dependent methyltransferase